MPILSASTGTGGSAGWAGSSGAAFATGASGNARGTGAVDLQSVNAAATQVASGDYSCIPGGKNNTASGDYSFAFGYQCSALGDHAIAWGKNAYAAGTGSVAWGTGATTGAGSHHAVALGIGYVGANSPYSLAIQGGYIDSNCSSSVAIGGRVADAGGPYSLLVGSIVSTRVGSAYAVNIGFGGNSWEPYSVAIGFSNPAATGRGALVIGTNSAEAYGDYSVVMTGQNTYAGGAYSGLFGGWNTQILYTGSHSIMASGKGGSVELPASICVAGGKGVFGKVQMQLVHLDAVTDATTTSAVLQAISSELTVPTNGLFNVAGRIVAHNVTSSTASYWPVSVLVSNVAGVLDIIASTPAEGVATAATADNDARALTVTVAAVGTSLRFTVASSDDEFRWSGTFTVTQATD